MNLAEETETTATPQLGTELVNAIQRLEQIDLTLERIENKLVGYNPQPVAPDVSAVPDFQQMGLTATASVLSVELLRVKERLDDIEQRLSF
jgi:hypothetical protein